MTKYSVQIVNATQSVYPDVYKSVDLKDYKEAKKVARLLKETLDPMENIRLMSWNKNGNGRELKIN